MKRILLCGGTSFVAKGFAEILRRDGYKVDVFSRGDNPLRNGDLIKGKYLEIDKNTELADEYYAVINFAVLKDASIEDNILYLESLVEMCKTHHVEKLIHFSSIMVYDRNQRLIDEQSPIASSKTSLMRGYGLIKISTDEYFDSLKGVLPFELIRVRPGFVLADGVNCPFIKKLPFGIHIVLGNKKSTLPIVLRSDIHGALLQLLKEDIHIGVCHLFPDNGMTKYSYAKQNVGGVILTLPKVIFWGIPFILAKLHVMSGALYCRFEGMYITSRYSSSRTETVLNLSFK